jgi:hypothetical protein
MKKWSQHLTASSYPGGKPDFVKNAKYRETHDGASDDGFALIWMDKNASHRMFPVFSPETTWLSGDYLSRAWIEFPHDAAVMASYKIAQAAAEFDIEIPEIITKAAELCEDYSGLYTYTGSSDVENLTSLSISDEMDGTNTLKVAGTDYPITNLAELSAAEHWFERNSPSLGFADRMKFAYFIDYSRDRLKSDDKLASEAYVSDLVSQYLSRTEFSYNLGNELLKRAAFCNRTSDSNLNRDVAATYIKLATEVNGLYESNPIEVVEAIENLDKVANLGELWDTAIPNPIDTVLVESFSTEHQQAEIDATVVSKYAGMEDAYSVADALNLSTPNRNVTFGDIRKSASSGRLSQILGEKVASMLAENPMQTFEALPDHMKQVVLHESFRG